MFGKVQIESVWFPNELVLFHEVLGSLFIGCIALQRIFVNKKYLLVVFIIGIVRPLVLKRPIYVSKICSKKSKNIKILKGPSSLQLLSV